MTTDPGIRDMTVEDWPRMWPFLRAVVHAGETHAGEIRAYLTVPGAFALRGHGLVGLHVMFLAL